MKWYSQKGEQDDIVLSTRIRLARNITEYPFPIRLDASGREQVSNLVRGALSGGECGAFGYIDMKTLSQTQAISLAEKHIISPEFTSRTPGSALMLTKDESVSIMLCEEDHIRLQVIMPGLALEQAYDTASKIDDLLDSKLNYAFNEHMGYLTQCPTNLGNAMRASVMLHLPALTRCGQISKLASTVSKLGLTIRGAYGEGSKPLGDIYQLSNQITLGISEDAAISNLKSIVMQLISQERTAAAELVNSVAQEDRIYRALGILQNARLLSSDEFMELISLIRLGISTGILDMERDKINELTFNMQPATISAAHGEAIDSAQRDKIRAQTVREAFSDL